MKAVKTAYECDYFQGVVLEWFGFIFLLIFLCSVCNSSFSWSRWSMWKNAAIAIWQVAIPWLLWLVADHIDVGSSAVRAVTIKIYSCIVCSVSIWSSLMTLCREVYLPVTCTTPWKTEDFSKGRVFIYNTDIFLGRKFIDENIFGKASTGIQSWLLESWLVKSPAKLLVLVISPVFSFYPSESLLTT